MLVARGGDEGPGPDDDAAAGALRAQRVGVALRLNELAERIVTSPPTASRAVDALVSLGFVERVPDPRDRRAVQIRVTDYGRDGVAERVAASAKRSARAARSRRSTPPRRRALVRSSL